MSVYTRIYPDRLKVPTGDRAKAPRTPPPLVKLHSSKASWRQGQRPKHANHPKAAPVFIFMMVTSLRVNYNVTGKKCNI